MAASHNVVANLPLAMDGQALPSLAPMLEGVLPSVVNISTEGKVTVRGSPFQSDPFFERFFNNAGPGAWVPESLSIHSWATSSPIIT